MKKSKALSLKNVTPLRDALNEAREKLAEYEASEYSAALKRANEKIEQLQDANIRIGRALIAAFEYIDGLAGEDEMRAALNAYRLGESPNE